MNISFRGMFGKVVTQVMPANNPEGKVALMTLDYHPFKNEFKNQQEKDAFVKQYPASDASVKLLKQLDEKGITPKGINEVGIKIRIANELDITEDEYIKQQQNK